VLFLSTATLVFMCLTGSSQGAYPGHNGDIAYSGGKDATPRADIFKVDAVGAFQTGLTNEGYARYPAWSPDGTKLAFAQSTDIYVANPDGSGKTLVLDWDSTTLDLDWSPDGTKLVAELWTCPEEGNCTQDIYTMSLDGTELTNVTGGDAYDDRHPAWSPDGTKIAFDSVRDGVPGIFTMNPDGSGVTRITSCEGTCAPCSGCGGDVHSNPDWSPDGQKLAFTHGGEDSAWPWRVAYVVIVNADGSNLVPTQLSGSAPAWSPDGTQLAVAEALNHQPAGFPKGIIALWTVGTPSWTYRIVARPYGTFQARDPDWRPVDLTVPPAGSGYPRPKGAAPLRISYVVAYRECTAPNRTHGPPLAFGSCNPPQPESGRATVGTPDANGFPAQSIGHLSLKVVPGDPATPADEADVRIESSLSDVRFTTGEDFEGTLSIRLPLRVTDRGSTGTDASATVIDFPLGVPMGCSHDESTDIGSYCGNTTTVDALSPGIAKEGKRAIWEIGKVQLYEGGPPSSDSAWNWKPFATQGVFVP